MSRALGDPRNAGRDGVRDMGKMHRKFRGQCNALRQKVFSNLPTWAVELDPSMAVNAPAANQSLQTTLAEPTVRGVLREILTPGRAKLAELQAQVQGVVERLEDLLRRLHEERQAEDIRMPSLEALLPKDVEKHVQLQRSRLDTCRKLRGPPSMGMLEQAARRETTSRQKNQRHWRRKQRTGKRQVQTRKRPKRAQGARFPVSTVDICFAPVKKHLLSWRSQTLKKYWV
eukprot:6460344-Amphidinium_carterae.1